MYWIGYDIGSSSVKAALVESATGREVARVQSPEREMPITSDQPGWGEQPPGLWWEHVKKATSELLRTTDTKAESILGIGISYQMHGLVAVDRDLKVVRPSIIWCDSRAVGVGDRLMEAVGENRCRDRLLNAPGNFTLSKLAWVKEHEPERYVRIHQVMLPGDYIAMKFSGTCTTTASGLSEGILWDYREEAPATWLMEAAGIDPGLLPRVVPTFGAQAEIGAQGAAETGLREGTPILYRAGDQPNNALSLNVMQPGEVAATGGTSGVVYAISDRLDTRELHRVNHFAHVNHSAGAPRIGKLLCINGTGIQYSWMQQNTPGSLGYPQMNELAASVAPGAEGLRIFPFGNGAERMLRNVHPGASIQNLDFNIHKQPHLYRAALEGIAFSFVYGMELMAEDGVNLQRIRAGNDNLFRARPFAETITTLTGASIEMVATTGAAGAARAAAVAAGAFPDMEAATATDAVQLRYEPLSESGPYREAYTDWKNKLETLLKTHQT
ncbi:xylulokinase [Robiginitalea sediminis]|uniref:xylulokinase n=1 Tax=Robiginitalea sediminis TaxID=1982593 RepID=UPI000B4B6ABE|nr:FGGY family carbohydrate kinase [Robiginitalea sediminis]